MNKIILATKRPWNWRVFLVLVGLTIPAAFAILPFSMRLQPGWSEVDLSTALGWQTLLLDRLANILLWLVLGGIGLALANRIGLGLPFVEGWVRREPIPQRLSHVVAIAWITAVALVLLSMFMQSVVFAQPMQAMAEELGIVLPKGISAPPLDGFLAAFGAGITEEMLYRLLGLSLLAWLGGLLFHDPDGRPNLAVFWSANVLFAIGFGAAHLPTAAAVGFPINAVVITETLVLNGIGGLAFGWLFWAFGLESAMLAHFLADVILYALIPLTAMPQGETTRMLAIPLLVTVIVLTVIGAWRTLVAQGRRSPAQE